MSKRRANLYLESTEVPAFRTREEITNLLIAKGARTINFDYGENQKITGMKFVLVVEQVPLPFRMPLRIDPVFKTLNGARATEWQRRENAAKDREQAERVAWRQLLMWLKAQLAMVEIGMTETREIFLPYAVSPSGQTLFEYFAEKGFKMLAPPASGAQ